MRSSDRSLLASLGFADPDKGDSRHSLASQFLASEPVRRELFERLHRPTWMIDPMASSFAEVEEL